MTTSRNSRVLWSILLLTAICLVSMPAEAKYGGGTGEPDDPYLISTDRHMNTIGRNPNDWDKHFMLMADIDLSDFTGTDFNIIGYYSFDSEHPFTGVFDGNDHTISNFSYSSDAIEATGLFGYGGLGIEIKNLGLIDPNVEAGEAVGVGSLVGLMEFGIITNCYVQNGNVSGMGLVGGLAGTTFFNVIADCNVSATVSGWDKVGGVVGENFAGIVGNCRSVCSVFGIWRVGGLAGSNDLMVEFGLPGLIAECCSEGIIEGFDSIGGLVGDNFSLVMNCYTAAEVGGIDRVGGLIGYNYLWPDTFTPPEVSYCYSVGSVSGSDNVGGLVGINEGGRVTSSFWDTQSSGRSGSSGGMGRTTSVMQRERTFTNAGWDFVDETTNGTDDIWWILEDQDYPRLNWELIEDEPNEVDPPEVEPPGVAGPLSEATDTNLIFDTGGDAVWFSQTETYYHNDNSAQSGDIADGEESWLQTTVSGAGMISFYWKVSSESSCDYLAFYIDGSRQDRISGSESWRTMTYEITGSGLHTLEWRYYKDGSVSERDDCGWVDKVEWVAN
ncbi:MAG: hypothetical protein GY845_04490 [Planctomycetes bacterium]|nr:hypothetical protein [Planctomycetota bacterium]